jgi:hypothetical protein
VGLVERRGVGDRIHAARDFAHEVAGRDGAGSSGEGPVPDVDADHVASLCAECPHQAFAEVPRASRDEYAHLAGGRGYNAGALRGETDAGRRLPVALPLARHPSRLARAAPAARRRPAGGRRDRGRGLHGALDGVLPEGARPEPPGGDRRGRDRGLRGVGPERRLVFGNTRGHQRAPRRPGAAGRRRPAPARPVRDRGRGGPRLRTRGDRLPLREGRNRSLRLGGGAPRAPPRGARRVASARLRRGRRPLARARRVRRADRGRSESRRALPRPLRGDPPDAPRAGPRGGGRGARRPHLRAVAGAGHRARRRRDAERNARSSRSTR